MLLGNRWADCFVPRNDENKNILNNRHYEEARRSNLIKINPKHF